MNKVKVTLYVIMVSSAVISAVDSMSASSLIPNISAIFFFISAVILLVLKYKHK